MARKLRIGYPGAVYHVMSRGFEGREIFFDARDKDFFLSLFSRAFKKYGLLIHSYVLMDNHYHLLIETPEGNVSAVMKWLNVTYGSYFNWRHNRVGPVFQGRFKDKPVEKDSYMVQASLYIHLNPYRAGLEDRLGSYSYSSIKEYTRTHKNKDITVSTVLGLLSEDKLTAVKEYRKLLQAEKLNENSVTEFDEIISGSKEFIEKIISSLKKKDTGAEIPLRNLIRTQLNPEDIIRIVCEEAGVSFDTLNHRDKNNRMAKNISIYMIKTYTSLTNKANGELFGISYSGVTQCCYRLEKQMKEDKDLSDMVKKIEEKVESQLW